MVRVEVDPDRLSPAQAAWLAGGLWKFLKKKNCFSCLEKVEDTCYTRIDPTLNRILSGSLAVIRKR